MAVGGRRHTIGDGGAVAHIIGDEVAHTTGDGGAGGSHYRWWGWHTDEVAHTMGWSLQRWLCVQPILTLIGGLLCH